MYGVVHSFLTPQILGKAFQIVPEDVIRVIISYLEEKDIAAICRTCKAETPGVMNLSSTRQPTDQHADFVEYLGRSYELMEGRTSLLKELDAYLVILYRC